MHIYIYTHTYIYRHRRVLPERLHKGPHLRDKNLYTTTNKCLQCLFKIMYTVFKMLGVCV